MAEIMPIVQSGSPNRLADDTLSLKPVGNATLALRYSGIAADLIDSRANSLAVRHV